MKIKFKEAGSHYHIVLLLTVAVSFVIEIMYGLVLIHQSIRQNIITIGAFSQQIDEKAMNHSMNSLFSDDADVLYRAGLQALEQTGYSGSGTILFARQFWDEGIWLIGVLIVLFVSYVILVQRQKRAYFREVEYVVNWMGNALEDSWQYAKLQYTSPRIIQKVCLLKEQIKGQKRIHEEDTTCIMDYMENISHQLKTPLAVIRAVCERLSMKYPDTEEKLAKCLEQSDKMTMLIRDFLQLGRFDCNKQTLKPEYIAAADLIETVLNNLDMLAKEKNLSFRVHGEKNTIWYCDVFWMEEILGNILKNCIEHSENGSIDIVCEQDKECNQIVIRDYGVGFREGFEKKVFERYCTSDRTSKNSSGLGLAIAKQAIKLHFGEIVAANKEGGGVEFKIFFPKMDYQTLYESHKIP